MKTLIAAIAIGSIAVPALAEDVGFEVEYADLKLETAAGQKMLEKRIARAARQACGADTHSTGSRIRSPEMKKCITDMTAAAHRKFAALDAETGKGG